ncbi:MAG: NVEALA domain-containing protein [Bacteroides sp]|nr:NVEALA domain-containing protein [Bacteroides sp.]
MNKKYVKATLVAVVALIGGINVFNAQKTESLSDIALSNVEALADDEINPLCPTGCFDNGAGCYCNDWHPSYREPGKE